MNHERDDTTTLTHWQESPLHTLEIRTPEPTFVDESPTHRTAVRPVRVVYILPPACAKR